MSVSYFERKIFPQFQILVFGSSHLLFDSREARGILVQTDLKMSQSLSASKNDIPLYEIVCINHNQESLYECSLRSSQKKLNVVWMGKICAPEPTN